MAIQKPKSARYKVPDVILHVLHATKITSVSNVQTLSERKIQPALLNAMMDILKKLSLKILKNNMSVKSVIHYVFNAQALLQLTVFKIQSYLFGILNAIIVAHYA